MTTELNNQIMIQIEAYAHNQTIVWEMEERRRVIQKWKAIRSIDMQEVQIIIEADKMTGHIWIYEMK
jgi:hypothetical protein